MNNGQSHPSSVVRLLTDERVLATYRAVLMAFVGLALYFGQRTIASIDDGARQLLDLRREIGQQINDANTRFYDLKGEVARMNATTVATMTAIQDRVSAQSRRLDSTDGDVREINKRLYEGRVK